MNIGFDLDRVFIRTPPLLPSFIIDKFYYQKELSKKTKEQNTLVRKIKLLSHIPLLRKPYSENITTLRTLSHIKQYKLFLISGRTSLLETVTNNWLKKYRIENIFTKILLNVNDEVPPIFKDEAIKKSNIDIFIDDDIYTLLYLSKNNPQKQFIWIATTNKHLPLSLPKNITHIHTLSELLPLIEKSDFHHAIES